MNTNINILVETLVAKLHIDRIYHWTYARDGKKLSMLHIHLQKSSGLRFGDAKELCFAIFEKYKDIYFTIYYQEEIQQLIEQGLGRFSLVCRAENIIYQNDKSVQDITLPKADADEIANQSEAYIDIERSKVASFLDGYHFYVNTGNAPHAAFMLHQALELILRTAFMLLVGYEKKSHNLVNNIAHLKTYDSVLGRLCIKDRNQAVLRLLDNSYSAFRYTPNYQIAVADLETAYRIVEKAIAWIEMFKIEYIEEIKNELAPEYIAQKRIQNLKTRYAEDVKSLSTDSHKEFIISALQVYCTPKQVNCFAYRCEQRQLSNILLLSDNKTTLHQYYLLLATSDERINTLDLQDKINQLLPSEINITLILEREDTILNKAQQGHPFFCNVIQNGETWLQNGNRIEKSQLPATYRNMSYLNKQWGKRIQNAEGLLNLNNRQHLIGDERAICFVLAIATEQVCLGLIKSLLGYSSHILNLNYLMKLVDVSAPHVSAVFRRENEEDNNIFKLLTEAQQRFRHAPNYRTQGQHLEVLAGRVKQFIAIAHSAVESYLSAEINTVTPLEQEQAAKGELYA
ncbi:HEPN domain-containing protein [Sphingobacterium pedocola]|uniref:HEPN domain-containing protein n=1 Tax=Sphingobacterium pedocola TaxID=2082722 RepID=A0ABR9T492_9SPHI|nr:HEPN domain-containing protein [Sphingobacterium pedocola]MBE8720163.1 hypothetical protein [Sphingobacterium pedocola]